MQYDCFLGVSVQHGPLIKLVTFTIPGDFNGLTIYLTRHASPWYF